MSENEEDLENYTLFVCNSGLFISQINLNKGYSTFINVEGLTQFLQQKRGSDRVIYADAPGLADAVLRERAGEEITNALQQNGVYRIYFVVILMSRRVMKSDFATVEAVMRETKIPNVNYSIIVNKLRKGEQHKGVARNENFLFQKNLDGSENVIFDESDNSKDYAERIRCLEKLLLEKAVEFEQALHLLQNSEKRSKYSAGKDTSSNLEQNSKKQKEYEIAYEEYQKKLEEREGKGAYPWCIKKRTGRKKSAGGRKKQTFSENNIFSCGNHQIYFVVKKWWESHRIEVIYVLMQDDACCLSQKKYTSFSHTEATDSGYESSREPMVNRKEQTTKKFWNSLQQKLTY
ncbi:hypothetical protein HK099_006823 [Clydaea vesicula]|uniref:AIG1-type G domain-containing protein n=1 Tax=Clydaea vesicula TaxID=447962 RepID=A0AAD5XU25_9FUNG|nr:hypothetical protein HK099_006823 [Clydaea vesicula]